MMEGAEAEVETEVVGPPGWFTPQIPAGANILSESPIAYTLDNLLTGASGGRVADRVVERRGRWPLSGTAWLTVRAACAAVDDECDHLIKVATPLMKRALVSGDAKGEVSNVRTNSVGWVAAAGDRVLEAVEDRICDLFGCAPEVSLRVPRFLADSVARSLLQRP